MTNLQKTLSLKHLLILGLAACVGGGVMTQIGREIHLYTGAGIVISYLLAGIGCILVALPYCELSSMIPCSGSLYTYGKVAFGNFFSWIMLGLVLGELISSCSVVAFSFAEYINEILFNYSIYNNIYFKNILSNGIVVICGLIITRSMHDYKNINLILVISKFIVILIFIIFSLNHISYNNITLHNEHQWNGVLKSVSILFFSFTGFTSIVTYAEESINPSKDISIAIILSIIISTITYMIVGFLLSATIHYSLLDSNASLSFVLIKNQHYIAGIIVSIGAAISMISVILACLYASSRILFVISRDNLISINFTQLNSFNMPNKAIYYSILLILIILNTSYFDTLIEISSLCAICIYIFGCLLAIYFRIYYPQKPRPFKSPFLIPLSLIGIIYLLYFFIINAFLSMHYLQFVKYILIFSFIYLFIILRKYFARY